MNEEKFILARQIAKVLEERRMMKCVLAQKLGVSESTAVHLTKRKKIDVEMLHKMGIVLRYNFFKHYPVDEGKAGGLDKDKIIEELKAKNAELEKQVEKMKRLKVRYMKQGYEDLRKANEMLLASLNPKLTPAKVRRKRLKNGNVLFG